MDSHRITAVIIILVVLFLVIQIIVVVIVMVPRIRAVKRPNMTMSTMTMKTILHGKNVKMPKLNNTNTDIITRLPMTIRMLTTARILLVLPLRLLQLQQQQQQRLLPLHLILHLIPIRSLLPNLILICRKIKVANSVPLPLAIWPTMADATKANLRASRAN
jgi:hypothetical protein